jgi:hypothetical protein
MRENIKIFSRFDMRDWQQMDAFFALTHGEKHVLRNRPLFDWFFLRNGKEAANLIVAYAGSKLISLLGYLPTKFLWGKETIEGAWMAHWMTLEGYRSGIGALLMRRMTELYPIVAGQGASAMNQDIVTKMEFKFQERIPKVVGVFHPDKVEQQFGFRSPLNKIDVPRETPAPIESERITDALYSPDWVDYPCLRYGTLRDADYLNHRYIDYPFLKYHVFVEGPRSSPAVCVSRIIETSAGIRVARMLEFYFPETGSGKAQGVSLIRNCLAFFESNRCDYVDFYCTSEVPLKVLLELGFSYDSEGRLPSLLDPIDLSRRFQNMELHVARDLKETYPDSEKSFYLTRADGDQDRPNESYRGLRP